MIFSWQYVKFCQIRKIDTPKILPMWVFVAQKCQQNVEILQLVWTLTPNKFWTKCLRCLIFTQKIVFHPYFREITTSISICLQLNHNGCSNLLLNLLAILATNMELFYKKLVNVHHFVEHYEIGQDEELIWSGKWNIRA